MPSSPTPPRDPAQLLRHTILPAAFLAPTTQASASHLGGSPSLPPGFSWPTAEDEPLAFIACLDLSSLSQVPGLEWLPATGRLLFFYDTTRQPWGYDPEEKDQWRVLLVPPGSPLDTPVHPAGFKPFVRQDVTFECQPSYPPPTRPAVQALNLSEDEVSAFETLRKDSVPTPHHQVGGYPWPMHEDDMELECALASSGVHCGGRDYEKSPGAAALAERANDWRLLLQVDHDPKVRMEWPCDGRLYFWVQPSKAIQGDFSSAWVVFQCG